MMLSTEGQWVEVLANNNIRAIICWLRKLTAEGDDDIEEILATFSCWVQRTSEFTKKELLTLCFSRCQGLWMFLDRSSFTRVHLLLQRLRNLLTLAQWARRQLTTAHLWHGVGYPCVVCRDTVGSSEIRHACWNREHRALKQHIWLGKLVQWWGIMGLLPKYPEAHEVKRITQMWKEMEHSHQKAHVKTPGWEEGATGRRSSFIQGMMAQLEKRHGCIWTSDDCTDKCYPPPNLQALLKLVLVPHIDNICVSDAWALLKRGHTESDDMVTYFLQTCNEFGLYTKALKCISAELNGEGDNVNRIETTEPQSPLMKKDWSAGRPPCPLSAKLYQAQRINTEELMRLVKKAVIEVKDPPHKSRDVVWPEHVERKLKSRKMSLSTQALLHLTPSPSPVDVEEQVALTDDPAEERPIYDECERCISSSEEMSSESVSSFTSASSFLLRRSRPYVYESTITLQRISSLLTDENQSGEKEDEDSRPPSSVSVLPDFPEIIVTPDGTKDPPSLRDLKTDLAELVSSAEGPSMDETLHLNKRMIHPLQLCRMKLSQSVPSLCELPVEEHSLLSLESEKEENQEETVDGLATVLAEEHQSASIMARKFSSSEAVVSDCFLEEEPHKKGCEDHQQKQSLGHVTQRPLLSPAD
ncbi:uncharacterized protein LOC115036190 [Echeneis naucrates]|uniref:uncharacterized protein LOC115036190 n=1 Tax=Echeneis naucrates TaxID=173247 RepID=UPI00111412B1|nr:uncharacterized protein LOC115036190 [Echeneis naucrates]